MQKEQKAPKRMHRTPTTHAIGLRLTEEQFAIAKSIAAAEHRSLSSLARMLVTQGLAQIKAAQESAS